MKVTNCKIGTPFKYLPIRTRSRYLLLLWNLNQIKIAEIIIIKVVKEEPELKWLVEMEDTLDVEEEKAGKERVIIQLKDLKIHRWYLTKILLANHFLNHKTIMIMIMIVIDHLPRNSQKNISNKWWLNLELEQEVEGTKEC